MYYSCRGCNFSSLEGCSWGGAG